MRAFFPLGATSTLPISSDVSHRGYKPRREPNPYHANEYQTP